jgi:hypothetical protein
MAGIPGEDYARLLVEIFTWVTDPTKYAALSREKKLEKLRDALTVCLDNRDMAGADVLFAEYRKLLQAGS